MKYNFSLKELFDNTNVSKYMIEKINKMSTNQLIVFIKYSKADANEKNLASQVLKVRSIN